MGRRFRFMFVAMLVACAALMAAASPVLATVWDVSRLPGGVLRGHVSNTTTTTFTVTNSSGTKVGKVVKATSGGWKVFRGTAKIAVAKRNGTTAYPVNLYDLSGTRIARCRLVRGAWWVERDYGNGLKQDLASVPKGCSARAAIGAVRLVDWR